MTENEVRKFTIDKKYKETCKTKGLKQIKIKKEKRQNNPVEYRFFMEGEEEFVYSRCKPGYIPDVWVFDDYQGCGIGKTLTKLCLNEKTIHNTNNEDNSAVREIVEELEVCKTDKSCDKIDLQMKTRLEKWATSECSKLLWMDMCTDPKSKAHAYFNSAIETGFTELLIKLDFSHIYPKEGPCSVSKLKNQYNKHGYMTNEKTSVNVWGKRWLFCSPKNPGVQSVCTIW